MAKLHPHVMTHTLVTGFILLMEQQFQMASRDILKVDTRLSMEWVLVAPCSETTEVRSSKFWMLSARIQTVSSVKKLRKLKELQGQLSDQLLHQPKHQLK